MSEGEQKVPAPVATDETVKMIVTEGVLKLSDLPAVYKEFRKPIDEAGLQESKGEETHRGYDTLGYGYAWITERLNDVVGPQCWRAVIQNETVDIVKIGTRDGFEVNNEVVLQLGNWRETDKEGAKVRDFQVLAESFGFGGHRAFGRSDARKGGFTNGLKKAAGIMGIGNDAYKKAIDEENSDVASALADKRSKKKGGTTVPKDDAVQKIKTILMKRGAKDESSALAMFEQLTGLKWTTFQGITQVQAQRGFAALLQAANNQR